MSSDGRSDDDVIDDDFAAEDQDLSGDAVHLDEHGNPRIIERHFKVDEAFAGHRIDHYLKRMIPRLSRTKLQHIIRTQVRRADGRPLKPSSSVMTGDEFILRREARPEPPCPRTFEVLYRDDHMMVIDKPAGLPMHVSAKFYFNTLTCVLRERYPDERVQICHRIDRETSGALVVARSREAAAALKGQFSRHRVGKTYLAIVHGTPPWDETVVDLPLGLTTDPDALIGIRMVVRDDAPPARTHVKVLTRAGAYALLECKPVSGRQHQIRVHLAEIGHPIVGDKLYAHSDQLFAAYCDHGMTDELLERFILPRQALHAHSVRLLHPESGEELQVDSPLPDDLRDFLASQG